MADKDTWKEFLFITDQVVRLRADIGQMLYRMDGVDRKMNRLMNDAEKKKSFKTILDVTPDWSMENLEKTWRNLQVLRDWLLSHDLFVDGK